MSLPFPLRSLADHALEQYRQSTNALLLAIVGEQQARARGAARRQADRAAEADRSRRAKISADRRAVAVAAMLANGHPVAAVAARYGIGLRTVRRDARRASVFLARLESGAGMEGDEP